MLRRFFNKSRKPDSFPEWVRDLRPDLEYFRELQKRVGKDFLLLKALDHHEYLALGPDDGPYHLKVLEDDPEIVTAAKREFEVRKRLASHPHLAPFTYASFESSVCWLARPKPVGDSVAAWLDKGPHSPDFVEHFLSDCRTALEALWDAGLLYADWTTTEIRFHQNRWILGAQRLPPAFRHVAGTHQNKIEDAFYLSPEAICDNNSLSPRSDLFSLGAMAYHLLSGAPPFPGENPLQVILGILQIETPELNVSQFQVPTELAEKIFSMLEKSATDRKAPEVATPTNTAPPSAQIVDFLEDASRTGRSDGVGQFTLQPEKALEKLRDYQFQKPTDILYAALAAAPGLKAQSIAIESTRKALTIKFAGAALSPAKMESILLHACQASHDDHLTHLGRTVVGALGGPFSKVEILSGEHKVTFIDLKAPTTARSDSEDLIVRCSGRQDVWDAPPTLKPDVAFSKIPISWNRKPLNEPYQPGDLLKMTVGEREFELDIKLNMDPDSSGLFIRNHCLSWRETSRLISGGVGVIVDGPWKRDASYRLQRLDQMTEPLRAAVTKATGFRLAHRLLEAPVDWTQVTLMEDIVRAVADSWETTLENAREAFPEEPASLWQFLFWAWLFVPAVKPPREHVRSLLWSCSQIDAGHRGFWDIPLSEAILNLQRSGIWQEEWWQDVPVDGFAFTHHRRSHYKSP